MIRALMVRSLRQHAGLLGILSLSLLLFQWAIVWVAAQIETGPGFREFLSALLPSAVLDTIFGQFGFASFGGAVSFGYQHPFSLVVAIAMVMVMATLPAHERERGLLDLILARPLPRRRYVSATWILVVVAASLSPLAMLGGGALGLAVVEAPEVVSWTSYLPAAGGLFLLLLSIGGYTLLFATDARRRGRAISQAVGMTLLFYWLDFMGGYWDLLESARFVSPFHFFDPADAVRSGLSPGDAAILGGIFVSTSAGAFLHFRRQDL